MVTGNSWNSQDPAQVAKGGTGVASTTAYAVLCGGTTTTASLQSIAGVGTSGQVLTSNGAAALPTFQAASGGGTVVQQIRSTTSTAGSTATTIPFDDSIPQNTEGAEVLTATITPTNTNNILIIEFDGWGHQSAATQYIAAIFQDSTADALYATVAGNAAANGDCHLTGKYSMVAGTGSSTTFKLRLGGAGGTAYWLRAASGTKFSTVNQFNLIITEIEV